MGDLQYRGSARLYGTHPIEWDGESHDGYPLELDGAQYHGGIKVMVINMVIAFVARLVSLS